tara:strand:- start:5263 stop:12159 length:6897 start_codon:yes stop_codon:yes gene_type:complete
MANRIQLRRDGAQQWANVNPILAQGEIGIEIDTSRIKIGDGVTPWNSLKYERPIETESNTANTLVKRDADGNFAAGAITASLIGNSATATRLANTRSITLAGDMSGSASFDGSANVNITAELNYVTSLPHYDASNLSATGTYTQLVIDSRGRIINAANPTSLSQFGITDAQPLDADLSSLANMTGFGLISRSAAGTLTNRQITGAAARILVSNGTAQNNNPLIDLADTPVVVGQYNPNSNLDPSKISIAGNGNETVNATQITVDRYGRLTQALTIPIATATEGSVYPAYDNSTAYSRFAIVEASNAKVYQAAIRDIGAGLGEPSHTDTSDAGGWRYLWSAQVEQKGLASFAQEDFDVTVWDGTNGTIGGHVTIAENAIENSQLQSAGKLIFTDQNATEEFILDKERTTDNAYHGITKVNHVNINNRTGGSVFRVVGYDTSEYPFQPSILSQGNSYPAVAADDSNGNGSATSGSSFTGAVDINLDTTLSGNLTLDVTKTDQFIKRTSGNVEFALEVNEAANRSMDINVTNAGSGDATLNITSDQDITINVTDVDHRVNIEDFHIQDNVISTTNATMVLDPNDDDDLTGTVRIRGDLTVDGVTTTVNSTVVTIQDPIMTLGGEDTLTTDDNKDRGIEFRYYDSQERFGFYGWDEDYADSNIWPDTGGFRFLYNATNSSEVYSGTDAPIIAGNLRLTTNTSSTWKTPTTGTLVVTGGTGISENLNVGGTTHLLGNVEIDGTVDIDANFAVRNNTTDKFTVESATGNTVIEGTVDIQLETEITDNLIITADNKEFKIRTASSVDKFVVDTDNGNTVIQGTLNVVNPVDFDSTLNVDSDVTFNATLDVDDDATFHNDITLDTGGKFFTITNGIDQTFRITSQNGNTDIEGTLNVGGFNTLERTNNIVVDATTSESAITLTTDGNSTFAGGVNIEKDVRIATDLYVSDRIVVKDAGTARSRPSLLNNVDIKYHSYLGASNAQNAAFADDPSSNLRVAGGAGIVQDLHIGDDLYIGKVATNDNVEFSVLGENGNTTIGRVGQGTASAGTLTVHGDATFNREVNITGALTTIGDANTDVLTVNAVSTFTDDVTVNNNLEVDGNVIVNQNLTVHGTTTTVNSTVVTLDDPIITLGGDTAPGSNDGKDRGVEFRYYDGSAKLGFFGWDENASRYAFYHNATNTGEVFSGNRSGVDAGSLKLFDTTNATNSGSGTLIVGGGAGIGLDLFVGDDLVVADAGSFGGNVGITGTLDVTSDFAVNSTKFTVASATGNTVIQGTVQVDGNATIGNQSSDSHTVTGTVTFNQAITSTDITADQIQIGVAASNEIDTTAGNLILDSAGGTVNITDNADVDGNLNVDGNTQIDGTLTVDGNTTIGNAAGDAHSVTGTVTFNQAITSTDITADNIKIGVDGATEISTTSGNLILDSQGGKVHITDNAEVDGSLQVDGSVTLGDNNIDTLTVNATSTFNAAITSTDITADNIQIGVSGSGEIDTSTGNLTLDSATGETLLDDNVTVSGTLDIGGQTIITDGLTLNAANEALLIQNGSGVTKFSVDSDNGNTDIQGTLDVNGATELTNTLHVTQGVDFDSTLNVDGITTLTDATDASTGGSFSASGALQLTGGASITKDLAIGSDIKVYGNQTIVGTTTLQNNVTAQERLDLTKNENPSNLAANAPLMIPNGGATIAEDVFIGQVLTMGPNNAGSIVLNGTTGNATIAGTLGITGITTASVINASTVNTSASIGVGGSLIINTDKFTVQGSTGNTDIAGTLDVAGRVIIDDTLNVTQGVDLDSTLNVDGAATFNNTITQNSTSLFRDNVVLRGASKTLQLQNGSGTTKVELQSTSGNITAGGLTTTNSLEVVTNTTIGGTLGVTGQITGNVTGDLTGTADKGNLIDVTDTTTSNLTYFPTFVSTNGGYTEIRTDSTNLTYNPSTNRLTVANFRSTTDFEVQGNLTITGALTFGQSQVGSIANHDTDALAEGTSNLYFTDERVDDRVAALISGGTGITATYNDAGDLLTLSATQSDINTDNITEGSSNLFTTAARTRSHFTYGNGIQHNSGTLSVTQSDINTDNLTEGSTNVFFTNSRTRGALSASGDLGYNASTGVFSFTERTDAEVNGLADTRIALQVGANLDLSSKSTADLAEDSNLYYTNARADARIALQVGANLDLSNQSTSDLSEGTNLYYTDARADARIANAAGDYATAAQGALAASATQPGDLATVATSGSYNDLSNLPTLFSGAYADLTGKPTLGSAAATDSTAYATAAQGTKADANDTDIDDIYTALNAIGNDASVTTVAQLKAALAALTR